MNIIECTKCKQYYDTEDCYYKQTAADDYIYRCPEGHDLVENEIEDMNQALEEMQGLTSDISKRDRIIRALEQKILKLESVTD